MKELILRAKNGDSQAIQQIIKKYTPLAIKEASKYHIPDYEFKDLVQHCYLSIIKAIKLYKVGTNPFGDYVTISVRNNMEEFVRHKVKHNRERPMSYDLRMNSTEYLFTIEDQVIAYEQIKTLRI
ncbi:hypothetical protein SH2C18_30340 [Clostridium sediminicola]|uniref:helix-turn-helix domain-containing protein n=1 Tax=Clostridium sediminicola TaxID=3114879 RepID=UPI0031F1E3F7